MKFFLYLLIALFISAGTVETAQAQMFKSKTSQSSKKHKKQKKVHKIKTGKSGKKTTIANTNKESVSQIFNGKASYYADKFNGRKTANGEIFSNKKMTAAHRTLPFGTRVRVTNPANGKSVIVRINDRGPFSKDKSRIIDLSKTAAENIGIVQAGVATVKVEVLKN